MDLADIDLCDPGNFVSGVPHHWFAQLRKEAPVYWHPDPDGFAEGFWAVTRFEDCVGVNRDYETSRPHARRPCSATSPTTSSSSSG